MELDEQLTDSSPVTAADVDDFGDYFKRYTDDRLGRDPRTEAAVDDKPAKTADMAPATREAPTSESDDKQTPVKPEKVLTQADVDRIFEEKIKSAQPKAEPKADPRPRLEEERFKTHGEYEDELEKWEQREMDRRLEGKLSERDQKAQSSQQEEREFKEHLSKFEERTKRLTERGIDWTAVKATADSMPFHQEGLQYILKSEFGPEMIEYFTRNQSEWASVIAMQPERRERELEYIERDIKRGQTAAPPARPAGKTVSTAKEPPKILGGKQAPTGDPKDRDNSTPDDETGFAAHNKTFISERLRNTRGQFTGHQ